MEQETATLSEDMIFTRTSGFPKRSILAFLAAANGGTTVYVGDREYTIDITPERLLEELGGSMFYAKVTDQSRAYWIRRHSAYDVEVNSLLREVSIWLLGRRTPIWLEQVEVDTIYRQLGWIT